jgi:hypothetical protein
MKTKLLLFLVGTILAGQLEAQTQFFAGLNGGYVAKAIINQNNYGQSEMDYVQGYSPIFGLTLGVDLSNKHLVRLEPQLLSVGQPYEDQANGVSSNKDVKLDYIHIPLTYTFVVNGGSKGENQGVNFFITAGLYAGILNDASMDLTINGQAASLFQFSTIGGGNPNTAALVTLLPGDGNPADYKELYNSTDFGGIFGFGVQAFLSEKLKLSVEIRTGASLGDINSETWRLNNKDGLYEPSRNLYGGLLLGLSYYF